MRPLFPLLLLASSSCAQVLDIEDTTVREKQEPVLPSNFACKGTATAEGEVAVDVTILNVATGAPIPDLTVKVCPRLGGGVACAIPTKVGTTDAMGRVSLSINPNFFGFLRLEGDVDVTVGAEMLRVPIKTTNWYTMRPFNAYPSISIEVGAGAGFDSVIEGVLGLGPGQFDSSRGYLTFDFRDCDNKPAAGVQLSLKGGDAQSTIFYLSKTGFSSGLTQTDVDGLGRGGVFSLPPQSVQLFFRLVNPDVALNDTGVELTIEPNVVTTIVGYPRLDQAVVLAAWAVLSFEG